MPWPEIPNWTPPSGIHNNEPFSPADGLPAEDLNKIIMNLFSLAKGAASVQDETLFL